MKSLFFIAWLLILSVGVGAAQTPSRSSSPSLAELQASYSYSQTYGGYLLSVNADGKFSFTSSGCTGATIETGSYTYDGGVLTLTTEAQRQHSFSTSSDDDDDKSETEEGEDAQPKTEEESAADDEPTVRRFNVVAWGARLYLMHQRDEEDFIKAINAGDEPRDSQTQRPYENTGVFMLRDGDEEKSVSGLPALRAELLERLALMPLTAKIINVISDERAMINIGSAQGVKKGLVFYDTRQTIDSFADLLVEEVHENYSIVRSGGRADPSLTYYSRRPPPF